MKPRPVTVTVTIDGHSTTRRYGDTHVALGAFEDALTRLSREYVRTGGRPKAGTLSTAHLRARDRRRKSHATVTLAQR